MNSNYAKQISDSNKENQTPSSYMSSASKFNQQNFYNENYLNNLKEKKESLISIQEANDSQYFNLVKKREELASLVMEKDSALFKEKAELEYLSDILREKEDKRNTILENMNHNNVWIENQFISKNLCTMENGPNQSVIIALKNDFTISGVRQKDQIVCNKFNKTNVGNTNLNEILDKEFNNDNELIKLFAAYNIV